MTTFSPLITSYRVPPLANGDHLTRDEFEQRYQALPKLNKAELIKGVVGSDAIWVTVPSGLLVLKGLAVLAHHLDCITTGVVYMSSPVGYESYGSPHADLIGWLWVYCVATPGVAVADNATVNTEFIQLLAE